MTTTTINKAELLSAALSLPLLRIATLKPMA